MRVCVGHPASSFLIMALLIYLLNGHFYIPLGNTNFLTGALLWLGSSGVECIHLKETWSCRNR